MFTASIPVFVAVSTTFIFVKWQKTTSFNMFSVFWFCWISHFYNVYTMIGVKLKLSSISSALLTWFVNQTSTEENLVLNMFIIFEEKGKIFINCQNCLFRAKFFILLWKQCCFKSCWHKFEQVDFQLKFHVFWMSETE